MQKTTFTFDQLPQAVAGLYDRLKAIESLLQPQPNQTAAPADDKWFDIDELREYVPGKLAKATIYGLVHRREIPHKKVGKRLAFLKSEIDAWLNGQARKTAAETQAEAKTFIENQKG